MRVRQARLPAFDKAVSRQNRGTQQPRDSEPQTETFLAPIDGWVIDENLAATRPNSAKQMINWWPTRTGVRVRGGCTRRATIGEACRKLFAYRSGTLRVLFAFGDTTITNVTDSSAPATPLTPSVTGRTSGDVSATNFSTGGVDVLYTVNASDPATFFNGLTWNNPTITGFDSSTASFVFEAGERLWFIPEISRTVYYLPINQFGGEATQLPLEASVSGGGSIIFGGTMSSDSGSGFNDRLIFVTSEGHFLLYSSTDPLTMSLVGRYSIGSRPLGKNAFFEIGGDIEVLTNEGMVSLRQAIARNTVEISLTNRSKAIEPYWQQQAISKRLSDWQVKLWPSRNLAVVSLPVTNDRQVKECFVVNLETAAWGYTVGWDVQTIEEFNGEMIFGDLNGGIHFMDNGGSDDGNLYTATCLLNPKHLGAPDAEKEVHMISTIFRASTPFKTRVTVATNYDDTIPVAPDANPQFETDNWDEGLWDVAKWDTGLVTETVRVRDSVGKTGFVFSPRIQVTSGTDNKPQIELTSQTVTYTHGGAMR